MIIFRRMIGKLDYQRKIKSIGRLQLYSIPKMKNLIKKTESIRGFVPTVMYFYDSQ